MAKALKIDFVSDVSCPWCAVGLYSLAEALRRLDGELSAELHFQPFELNPQMVAEGEDINEHLAAKYGLDEAQLAQNRAAIRARGAEVGFSFAEGKRSRIYNTFDAHRLLHWAEGEGRQRALKEALFKAYFTDGLDPSDHTVLQQLAEQVGLDADRAAAILASDAYAAEVRSAQAFYQQHGIRSVPAIIINERHLISGGQPPELFERALREIAAQA